MIYLDSEKDKDAKTQESAFEVMNKKEIELDSKIKIGGDNYGI